MGAVSHSWLISAVELADQLEGSPTGTPVILDVRWTLAGSDPQGYRDGHIPGARYVDLDHQLAGPPGSDGRHPLPAPAALQECWRSGGIDDDSRGVVYDAGLGLPAARAWWLLRWSGLADVRFLDGGLAAWIWATGSIAGSIERGEPAQPERGSITVRPGAMPVVDIDQAAELAATGSGVLLDARAAPRFRGEIEPLDPVAGHIPGAINLPQTDLVDAFGLFRPAAELARVFAARGVGPVETGQAATGSATRTRSATPTGSAAATSGATAEGPGRTPLPAAASCGSGVTACHLILAGALVGIDLAVYPGSYSQWCAAGRPVAVGG